MVLARLLLAAGLSLAVSWTAVAADPGPDDGQPMAVFYHADWCYNCKVLAPKYHPVAAEFADRIQLVTMDFTTDESKAAARARAKQLGIMQAFLANRATGWVELFSPSGESVGRILQSATEDEIRSQLASLAGST